MYQSDLLKDRVLVVTGGGSGLGAAMAKRFASLGATSVILGRRQEKLDEVVAEIKKSGGKAAGHSCDVRDAGAVSAAADAIAKEHGRIDGLVNNAAGNFLTAAEDLSPNGFKTVVDIVLNGTFNCTSAFGKKLIAAGKGGSIVNIVTTYAWTGSAFVLPSACAKAGVLAMTRSLAVEWAHYNIRVNAIAPGPVPTEPGRGPTGEPVDGSDLLRRRPRSKRGSPYPPKPCPVRTKDTLRLRRPARGTSRPGRRRAPRWPASTAPGRRWRRPSRRRDRTARRRA